MKQSHRQFSFIFLLIGLAYGRAQPQPGALLWSYDAGSTITTSPALAPDGTIYIGNQLGLYAITNLGPNKWTFAANLQSSPSIGSDGTIFFGDYSGTFYALNPDGSQKWSYEVSASGQCPALAADGTIYYSAGSRLYALSSTGVKKWDVFDGDIGRCSPVIGPDGTVYVGGWDQGKVYAFNPDGSPKWTYSTFNSPGDSAALGGGTRIYITGTYLYALSPDGTKLWDNEIRSFFGSSPALGKDGTIYVASDGDHSLYAIGLNGQILWNAGYGPTGYGFRTTGPAIDAGGMIYYSASNSVFAINPQGLVQWIFSSPYVYGPTPLETRISPTLGVDGTIYAAFGSTLYAIKGSTNGPTDSPWPMYRQNPRHTGRIEKPALNKPQKRADANFQFQIYTDLGKTNTIQTSPDLTTWTPLTNVVITNIPMDFIDWDASNFASRFYRAVQQ